jgi:glycosyltransferase involved in cell wall biosynthesis
MLCRNEEKHIEKTLRCLLKEQEEPPKEIIVVDRSTDRSPEIARSYGCKVLHPPSPSMTIGMERAWGIMKASYNEVLCADADSLYGPRWVAIGKQVLQNAAAVYGPVFPIEGNSLGKMEATLYSPLVPYIYEFNLGVRKNIFRFYGLDIIPYPPRVDIGVAVKLYLMPKWEPRFIAYSRMPTWWWKQTIGRILERVDKIL